MGIDCNTTLHNVQFVKYIFPRNRTTSDQSQNLKNTILLNIYLSQLVRVRGKYTFLSFSDFQTLDLWFPPKYVTVSTTGASRPAKYATVSATGACTVSRWPVCRSAQGNLIMTLYLIPVAQNMPLYLIPGPEKIQSHHTLQSTHCSV